MSSINIKNIRGQLLFVFRGAGFISSETVQDCGGCLVCLFLLREYLMAIVEGACWEVVASRLWEVLKNRLDEHGLWHRCIDPAPEQGPAR